jgi:ABC-type dipeptide/oligopeptide/nickel transport system permease subunit
MGLWRTGPSVSLAALLYSIRWQKSRSSLTRNNGFRYLWLCGLWIGRPLAYLILLCYTLRVKTRASSAVWANRSKAQLTIVLTLVAFGWMSYARLVRGNILSEREQEYIEAARSIGMRDRRILFRHLLPNTTHGLPVLIASDIGMVVVWLATFHFVGLIPATVTMMLADWGQMLAFARNWIVGGPGNAFEYWYTYLPVSAAIVLYSVGWNLIGDGLRDVLDPRLR